ncbi:hypothetical protein NHQ30_011141 [Ciborinia camelliae]|nr:hypothetical protein NHQ30_011141 [Ciborinia camelliae]
MASNNGTQKRGPDLPEEDGEQRARGEKKRKYGSSNTTKVESEDDEFYSEEEKESQPLSLHSTESGGAKLKRNSFIDSESSDSAPSKKNKFSFTSMHLARQFPESKARAVVKPSFSARQHEQHERGLPKRLAKLKAAMENLSDDWDVIMRAPEVAKLDALQKTIDEKDATISELKEENVKLKEDFAQQVDKVETFEQWKSIMKSTLA